MTQAPDRLAEDTAARARALAVVSFIVEAPAGAGKTELLTQRYLRLLAVVEHPEEVLALTFTNKAATEMRDRILGSLERAARGEMPEQPHKQLTFGLASQVLAHDAERGWGLLGHPGRLRITTLDALCASLARQMPYLSRFGAQPGVAEDADAHYATAARRTLEMVEAGTLNVAAALDAKALRHGQRPAVVVRQILESCRLPVPPSLDGARWTGTPALTRQSCCFAAHRLFLVGDAVGCVEPFTGEVEGEVLESCDLCGGHPECVRWCPVGALKYA
mgnify:CR=1 FL=1